MVVKTFRGLLTDGSEDKIRLGTIKGKVGYRIIKFQVMPNTLTASDSVQYIKITKGTYTQTTNVNFSDTDLLAVAIVRIGNLLTEGSLQPSIIFDHEIFNQDIFINLKNLDGTLSANYYIELEVIPLDDAGAEYTTLKDMRLTGT